MALGNINDIAMFVAVVKAGSFTIAAKQLGLTRSAVGKSIVRLEQRLNVRLLNRTPRSLSLTDDGEVFFRVARRYWMTSRKPNSQWPYAARSPPVC